jgi:hypothetical protein
MNQVHSDVKSVQRNSLQKMRLISTIKEFTLMKLLQLVNDKIRNNTNLCLELALEF